MDMIINYLHQGASAIIPFIILLGLLIFVHELGHFLVAKYFGVRVEVFSLGFGKKIFQYKRGDTNYCISLIPLGGYVKMFGDEVGAQLPESEKKFSFLNKPVYQRIGIVIAGPLMNFFFAILIFFVVALIGEEVRGPVLGDIKPDTEAYQTGFRSGDRIIKVTGNEIKTWEDFQDHLTKGYGSSVSVEVEREVGKVTETILVKPTLQPNPNILSSQEYIGDVPGLSPMSQQAVIGVISNSFAQKSGLKTGDRILSINNIRVSHFRQLENLFLSQHGEKIVVEIERPIPNSEKFEKLTVDFVKGSFSSLIGLGIESAELYLSRVSEDSPAQEAGLLPGDRIISVGSVTPQKWDDLLTSIKSYQGNGPLEFNINRNGELKTLQIIPKMTSHMTAQGTEEKRYTIGIMPTIYIAAPVTTKIKSENLVQAAVRGYDKTIDVTVMTIMSFVKLIQNKISPKSIGGVISIGQAASETFKIGLSHFLQMMAIISVNLFILNLLPIPILDGGHLLFYTIEAIRGAPLSMRKMEVAQQVGLVLLMSLMVFALFNDFSRLLGNW
jgi:regulator of sigma E protease